MIKSYGMSLFCNRCKSPVKRNKTINPRVQCHKCGGTLHTNLPVIWYPTTSHKSFLGIPYSKKTTFNRFKLTDEAIERINEDRLGIEIKEYRV